MEGSREIKAEVEQEHENRSVQGRVSEKLHTRPADPLPPLGAASIFSEAM